MSAPVIVWALGVLVGWVALGAVDIDLEEDWILFVGAMFWPLVLAVALAFGAVALVAFPFYMLGAAIRRKVVRGRAS